MSMDNIQFWDCKCGGSNVLAKTKCSSCRKPRADYEIPNGKGGTVKVSEIKETLKSKQKKVYDKKQTDISRDIPFSKDGSLLQSTMNRREKR